MNRRPGPLFRSLPGALGLLGLVLTLGACRSMSIEAAGRPGLDLGALHSFEWTPGPEVERPSPFLDEAAVALARQTVEEVMAERDRMPASAQPDFLLAVYAMDRTMLTADAPPSVYNAGLRRAPNDARTREVEETVIFLDVSDPATGELWWRATARNNIGERGDAGMDALITQTLRDMAERLFEPQT